MIIVIIICLAAATGSLVYLFQPKGLTMVGDYTLVLGSSAPASVPYANVKKVQDCLAAAKGQPVVVMASADQNGDTAVTSCMSYPSITGMTLKAPRTAGTYVYSNQTIPNA